MSSRLETSGSSNSTKRNMAQTKQSKNNSAPLKAATPEKQPSGTMASRNIVATTAARLSADERQRMIQEAAYYRAEKRGFYSGDEVSDWLEAEAEINVRFP